MFVASIVAILIVLGLMITLVLLTNGTEEDPVPADAQVTEINNATSTTEINTVEITSPTVTEAHVPKNGWRTEYGKRYYYYDDIMCVDLQEIDGDYYFFNYDGSLVMNSEVDYEFCIFKSGLDGKIDRVVIDYISGEWSDERYHFGNGGRSSILELSVPVEDCTSMSFYLEAEGKHGAKVNGTWKIYIRSNGKWELVQEVKYTEPSGNFDIIFDEAKSFDAITAHPTVQGNASYGALFYPENMDCSFDVLLSLLQ